MTFSSDLTGSPNPTAAFRRFDESDDALFYRQPRFVAHIEPQTIASVTQLYRETLPPGGAILDLMSSWVSHLPSEISYSRVVGLGMNAAELAANPSLESYLVQDLNRDSSLPFRDDEFEAATICVSIQYLTNPVAVLREVSRVLRAGSPIVITFSNRCFPTKAVLAWQGNDDQGHLKLVQSYLRDAGNWIDIEMMDRTSAGAPEPLLAVVARAA